MNQITDQLWVTDIDTAIEEETAHFDTIVTVCQDCIHDNVSDDCHYVCYMLADDEESAENWGGDYHYPLFSDAAESVLAALRDDAVENVLVHCHKGRNRSVAVCAAAIAAYEEQSFGEALSRVRDARSIANPNEIMQMHGCRFVVQKRRQ